MKYLLFDYIRNIGMRKAYKNQIIKKRRIQDFNPALSSNFGLSAGPSPQKSANPALNESIKSILMFSIERFLG